jgi:hypothetical protein
MKCDTHNLIVHDTQESRCLWIQAIFLARSKFYGFKPYSW